MERRSLWIVAMILASWSSADAVSAGRSYETSLQADTYCLHNMHALLTDTANLKNPRTEYCFGILSHSKGDESAAAGHFRKSAEAGYGPAQLNLGAYYAAGIGVQLDREEGLKWAQTAANQGAPEAQYAYAEMLLSGQDVTQADREDAKAWMTKAADAGYARAQFAVATLYMEGKWGPQDYEQALRLYRLAAAQGHPDAMFAVGVMTFDGLGIPADKPAGITMIEKAARLGVIDAQLKLAGVYAAGGDIARDDVRAMTWYDVVALHQGKRDPAADAIETRLTPEEVTKAETNAKAIAGPSVKGH